MSTVSFQGVSNLVKMYQGLSNTRPEQIKMTNKHPYAVGSEQISEVGQSRDRKGKLTGGSHED